MHLSDVFIQSANIALVHAFLGNQTHDPGIASAMLHYLSYKNSMNCKAFIWTLRLNYALPIEMRDALNPCTPTSQ